jgi:serine/threonine protein kinase
MTDFDPGATQVRDPIVGAYLGEYQVTGVLGEGGMGVVYRGVQPEIGKPVAIKVLRWELARDPNQMQRLLAEARAVNAIRHRGIVDIFGFGKLDDGRQYLVMELLEGETLDRLIAKGPIAPGVALQILDETLDALDAAHGVGVIHRDLKPSNVFLVTNHRGERWVKLLDFGLAIKASVPGSTTPQTHASMMLGTPGYMAPEQASGREVGPGTDLYATGVIAFEMLTGVLPFNGTTPFEVIYKHLHVAPEAPSSMLPGIPPELDAFVLGLLDKDIASRSNSASSVRAQVRRMMQVLRADETHVVGVSDSRRSNRVRTSDVTPKTPPAPTVPPSKLPAAEHASDIRAIAAAQGRPTRWIFGLGALGLALGIGLWITVQNRASPSPAGNPQSGEAPPANPTPLDVASRAREPAQMTQPPTESPSPKARPDPVIDVDSNVPCDAYEGARKVGPTPLDHVPLSPGAHHLTCKNVFGSEAAMDLALEPGATVSRSFAFRTGRLEALILPYATVTVDGKSHGQTPFNPIELVEGRHRVDLRLDEKRLTRTVVIRAGETFKLKVNMEDAR